MTKHFEKFYFFIFKKTKKKQDSRQKPRFVNAAKRISPPTAGRPPRRPGEPTASAEVRRSGDPGARRPADSGATARAARFGGKGFPPRASMAPRKRGHDPTESQFFLGEITPLFQGQGESRHASGARRGYDAPNRPLTCRKTSDGATDLGGLVIPTDLHLFLGHL